MTKNPIIQPTHWIENDPTVGCLILLNKPFYETLQYVVEPLRVAVPYNAVHCGAGATFQGFAPVGGRAYTMQSRNKEVGDMVAVRLVFSKHEVVQVSKTRKTTIEDLFKPYVQAAQTVSGVIAVGIGFNLSFPSDLQDMSLWEAGVTILFKRASTPKLWLRQEINLGIRHHA